MMAQTPLALTDGLLSDSEGVLWTHPGGDPIILTRIVATNESGDPNQLVLFKLDRGGGARVIARAVLEEEGNQMDRTVWLTMNAGDEISGVSTDASAVSYFLDGLEVSP